MNDTRTDCLTRDRSRIVVNRLRIELRPPLHRATGAGWVVCDHGSAIEGARFATRDEAIAFARAR